MAFKKGVEKRLYEKFLFAALIGLTLALFFQAANSVSFSLTGKAIAGQENENLETQNLATISPIIEIIDAEYLDSSRNLINNVYEELKAKDGVWSPVISDGEFVRVVFEQPLTSEKDITIFPRVVSGNPIVGVYESGSDVLLAEFNPTHTEKYNKIYLTNLKETQDTFDLKIMNGALEFDHIYDPTTENNWADSHITGTVGTSANALGSTDDLWTTNTGNTNWDSRFSLENPSAAITSTQTIRFLTRKDASGGGAPTLDAYVYENGALVQQIVAGTIITSTTGEIISGTFDASSITDRNNTEIRVIGTGNGGGPNGRTVQIDSILWAANLIQDDPPMWFDNSTNSTKAGEAISHRVRWTDETSLSGFIFSFDNGTGNFVNDSFVSMTGTNNWSNVTKISNATGGSAIRWRVYTNDSTNQWNSTFIFQYTTTVDQAPQWSNPLVDDSTPNPGQTIMHNVTWTEDNGLSYATLEINSTGANCDTTANVSSTILSGTSDVADLSWQIPEACEGKTIGWRQYANDSLNQWNVTSLQIYTVSNIAPLASFGANPVDNFNSSSQTISFDLKASDNLGIDVLALYSNFSGSWIANQTNTTPVNDTFWNVTVNGIPEGRYVWAVWANDTSVSGNNDFTDINRTLTVDLTAPSASVNSPLNQTYATNSITFNITATDALSGIQDCEYSLNGAANVSLTNSAGNDFTDTNSSMVQGSHTVNFYCTDFAGNVNGSESVTFFIDSINPGIEFVAPTEANASSKSRQWIFANVSIVETNFQNVTFKLFNSTGLLNESTFMGNERSINWTGLSNDNVQYWYNASSYDSVGNFNQTETRYITLTSDQAPTVSILFPENATYNIDVAQLNYSAEDDISLSHCWYSLDQGATNSSPDTGCGNFTGLTSNEGSNTWTVYANDSLNQLGIDVVTFFKDTTLPVFTNHQRNPSQPNEDQAIQVNVTVTEANLDTVILEFNNGTKRNYTVATSNGNEFFFTINTGNYTAHDSVNYTWYTNDTAGNLNSSSLQSFTVANQIPSVTTPAINDTTPETNDVISCNGGTFSDNDSEDPEVARFFRWFDSDALILGQTSQSLSLSASGLDKGDVIKCSVDVSDGFDNSSFVNSSNTATIQNSAPIITNPLTSVSWDANGSTFTYQYVATDADNDALTWLDNTTLFNINSTGYITDTPTESEAGIYPIMINVTDGGSNTINVFTYTINDVTFPLISFTTGTEANGITLARDWIFANVSITETNFENITFRLYNSSSIVNETTYTGQIFNINWTDLPNEEYSYNVTIADVSGNANSTETRTIILDTQGPSVTSLTESPNDPATYSTGGIYRFNATVTDPSLDTVVFEFDNINYTATSIGGNIYNATISDLAVGTYNYRWYANDTFGNLNGSASGTYTINKATPSLSIGLSPSATVTYGIEITATGSGCPSQLTCILYRNGVQVSNPDTQTLGVSVYNYTYNTTGNTNYTQASDSTNLTINKASGSVFTYLDNARANKTIEQFTLIWLNGTLENGTGNIKLYNNGTLINQGLSPLSNLTNFTTIGSYNITTIYDGNENFTSAFETFYVNVLEADVTPPQVSLLYPENASYNSVQTQLNYSASDNFELDACWYSLNSGQTNTTITCGQNITSLSSGQGSSTWTIYANDTKGLENSSSVAFFVDSISPEIQFANPTETNGSEITRNFIQVNVTASDSGLDKIIVRLYNSTGLVNSSISSSSPGFANFTNLDAGTYYFNATANDTLGNEASTVTRQVSLVKPTVEIILPENKIYITSKDLLLNFTVENADLIWYNLDGTGTNTTITGNTTFNTSGADQQHTLYLFANNTVGESQDSVTFTVNKTKLIIYYSNYQNNGSSTNFNKSSFEDLQNLSNIVLENTEFGKIQFNEAVNVTDDSNPNDNEIDLDSNTNISSNFIDINSTALPNFNKSATLSLYGLTFSNPRVLRGNEVCPESICTEVSYSSGIFVFNVTQFSNYSAEETPVESPATPAGGGGGGASSGSGVVECTSDSQCLSDETCLNSQCVKLFDIKIIDFESPAKLGEFFDFTYFVKGMANINNDVFIDFWIEDSDGIEVTSGSDVIYLGEFEEKTETTKVFLPSSVESGVYKFFVQVSYGAYVVSSHRTIEIEVADGVAIFGPGEEPKVSVPLIVIIIIVLFMLSQEKGRRHRKSQRSDLYNLIKSFNIGLDTEIFNPNPKNQGRKILRKAPEKEPEKVFPVKMGPRPENQEKEEPRVQTSEADLIEKAIEETERRNRQRKDSDEMIRDAL